MEAQHSFDVDAALAWLEDAIKVAEPRRGRDGGDGTEEKKAQASIETRLKVVGMRYGEYGTAEKTYASTK
jgi:hypothetical protein